MKMGALLSVAQAGPEPPRMIVVTYVPAKSNPNAPVIGLVGKAVTFDTGGVSIKAGRRHGENEIRHGRGRQPCWASCAHRHAEAERQSNLRGSQHGKRH